jgi:hypothetical protein
MIKIWSEECDLVIGLIDINNEDEFSKKWDESFNEEENDILGDCVFEGDIVGDDEDIEGIRYKEMNFENYVKELKEFCRVCLEENEEYDD